MTLETTIKTLAKISNCCDLALDLKEETALKIGIEAIKVVQDIKGMEPLDIDFMLPGETEDD